MAFKKSELLAPAGSIEALKAAVYAGADAVYFGGGSFNARAFAKNFTAEELKDAFSLCRSYGVKAYIVLNTVLTDKEIDSALDFVAELETLYKPDAYIVQDIGLISVLKSTFPSIPLHASTQMQLHSSLSAEAAKKLGLDRIVFARELSKSDIDAVSKCGLESEIFVHGAVCVSQSGGCLMSSFIGGRSGNRGKCAQPCRQMYNGSYPLSLKDMCYAPFIPEICAMGVDCLKIEGRMKSPVYVYETVRIYRKLLDECRGATSEELERLSGVFSRSGLSAGYYKNQKGKAMFGVRTEQDKEHSRLVETNIVEKKLAISLKARFLLNEQAYISVSFNGLNAEVYGEKPVTAINQPMSKDSIKERLCKTGGTIFTVDGCDIELQQGIMMPMSAINALRRAALKALNELIIENNAPKRTCHKIEVDLKKHINKNTNKSRLIARFEGKIPSKRVLNEAYSRCDRVDLPLWLPLPDGICAEKTSLILPRTVFDSDSKDVVALLEKAKKMKITQLTVPNIGMLPLCGGFTLHGDYTLNVTNVYAANKLKTLGFDSLTVSPEVMPQYIAKDVSDMEYIIYGKAPLMHTETCIISNVQDCKNNSCCFAQLRDKTGTSFPIMREYKHRNIIYNSVPTYLLDKQEKLNDVDHVLFFTNENDEDVLKVLDCYNERSASGTAFTRAAFRKVKETF